MRVGDGSAQSFMTGVRPARAHIRRRVICARLAPCAPTRTKTQLASQRLMRRLLALDKGGEKEFFFLAPENDDAHTHTRARMYPVSIPTRPPAEHSHALFFRTNNAFCRLHSSTDQNPQGANVPNTSTLLFSRVPCLKRSLIPSYSVHKTSVALGSPAPWYLA